VLSKNFGRTRRFGAELTDQITEAGPELIQAKNKQRHHRYAYEHPVHFGIKLPGGPKQNNDGGITRLLGTGAREGVFVSVLRIR
jgi:hypothetical protein